MCWVRGSGVLRNPLHQALPSVLVVVEPISDRSVSARNLKDELKYYFHPLEVSEVSLCSLKEPRQPRRSSTGKVLTVCLKKYFKNTEEGPNAVVIVLIEASLDSPEKLLELLSVGVGVVAVSLSHSPR